MSDGRDVVFLVADKDMDSMVKGFFGRDGCHKSLDCGKFGFEVIGGLRDPRTFREADIMLRPFQQTHRAVVMIDNEGSGSRGPDAIRAGVGKRLLDTGWDDDDFRVIVLDPELEVWFWRWDNTNVADVVWPRNRSGRPRPEASLWTWLEEQGLWQRDAPKPADPKAALERALREVGRRRSPAIYGELASKVTTRGCSDEAFHELCTALRTWFPPEAP